MFPEDRKYFRFRLRVLVLAFLLISPTQFTHVKGSGMPASCGEVATAWSKTPTVAPVQDPKFVSNLVQCLNEVTNVKNWKSVGELIQKLPELMEKALPIGKTGGLVVLSAYFVFKSYELHERAMNLAWDYKKHKNEFEALEVEMKPVRDFMETQLIPQWEKGNYANTLKSAGKLLQMLSRSSTVLQQLVQTIHSDAKKRASDKRWSGFYGVGATVVCAGSVYVGNIPAMVFTCGCSIGTIAFCVDSYYSLGETLTKMVALWDDTTKMREEIVKYRRQLEIAEIRGELEV